MDLLLKLTASILISIVLLVVLEKQDKPIAILLCTCLCCMIIIATARVTDPIIAFLKLLQKKSGIDSDAISILLKTTSAAVICEITTMICLEAGYGSLGKALQLVGNLVIIYLSIPLCRSFLEVITQLLGGL